MSASWITVWFWPAIGLAFLVGVQAARWWHRRFEQSEGSVNREYFKGLNFLLNEEPDKAIEVFIKALEVDSETVELHLALGGLFRRKGQVDRATRIHQNLIARPSLTDEQRLQAIYELAQDYYKAGLLDRAENLFLELKESPSYRELALGGLSDLYQQEKEWAEAIEASRQQSGTNAKQNEGRIAHYWCELAELAMQSERFDDARKSLRNALSQDRRLVRAVLLRGELHYRQREFKRALELWLSVAAKDAAAATLYIQQIIRAFEQINDTTGLRDFLLHSSIVPREAPAFSAWLEALHANFDSAHAKQHIFDRVKLEGLSGPVAEYLLSLSVTLPGEEGSNKSFGENLQQLAQDLLARAKDRRIEYTCQRCGFGTKSHYWLCPNCGGWDSFSV